jgi:hypothetical protein
MIGLFACHKASFWPRIHMNARQPDSNVSFAFIRVHSRLFLFRGLQVLPRLRTNAQHYDSNFLFVFIRVHSRLILFPRLQTMREPQ